MTRSTGGVFELIELRRPHVTASVPGNSTVIIATQERPNVWRVIGGWRDPEVARLACWRIRKSGREWQSTNATATLFNLDDYPREVWT